MSSEMDRYWYIGYKNDIKVCYNHSDKYVDTDVTKQREAIGNRFETFKDAKEALEKLKALKRLKDKGLKIHLKKQFRGDGIGYSRTIYTDFTKDSQEIVKDLDLIFGGEE